MELVNDDVVELLGDQTQPAAARWSGYLRTRSAASGCFSSAVEESEIRVGLHSPEHVAALAQDLLSMGDEENPADTADARCRTRPATSFRVRSPARRDLRHTRRSESVPEPSAPPSGSPAASTGSGTGSRRNVDDVDHFGTIRQRRARAFLVVQQPCSSQSGCSRVVPESFEAIDERLHIAEANVPLDATPDARCAQIARADEPSGRGAVRRPEQVGLRVEAGGRIVEHARLDRTGIVVLQVEEVSECDVLGDLEVVGRQDANLGASVECVGSRSSMIETPERMMKLTSRSIRLNESLIRLRINSSFRNRSSIPSNSSTSFTHVGWSAAR